MRRLFALAVMVLAAPGLAPAGADEGMWTFDNFPSAKVKAAHGFGPDKAWLDRVQKASVRLDNGCSASVVSRDGLVLTNHHCISDCAQALSTAREDLIVNGFMSSTRKDERICPGLEASILQSISDVTDRVRAGVADATPQTLAARRNAITSAIEDEACGKDQSKRCEVVSLYRGGQYKLYRYDRYQDVRLAFAPELQAAFFGGDPDNFNFPRYAFDMALLRLYRDGQPAKGLKPLKIDPTGAAPGELVFTSGHPGSTQRLLTISQLEFDRDRRLPFRIEYLAQLRGTLLATAGIGEEEDRQVRDAVFGVENSIKAQMGQRLALVEPAFFALKVAEEKRLRDALAASADLRTKYGDPFADMAAIVNVQRGLFMQMQVLESGLGAGSSLLTDARALLRGSVERTKPAGDRLPEFSASRLPSIERSLLAEAPVHPVLERLEIEYWLLKTREYLGADHPAVKALFGARSARDIAREIVEGSRLDEPAYRKRLWDNPSEVAGSNDPAIALIRRVDDAARAVRTSWEQTVSGPASGVSERIARLRFDVLGDTVYPDATFTLRLSYGTVAGWKDPAFGETPAFTFARGLWQRASGAFPFNLAPRWVGGEGKLAPDLQFNLVSTNDIIGGNSGSPLLDKEGRIVGLVFDGNIHSLGGAYGFDPALNRTVSVAAPLIIEGLRKIYGAKALADELTAG
jgi:hypothetical protein